MRTYLLLLMAFLSIVAYSQEKSILIHKKNFDKIKTIDENTRITIKTVDGKKYWGRFTVIDSASIMIQGDIVSLNSIVKIRRKTIAGSIAKPVFIVCGSVLVALGITGAVAVAGYGIAIAIVYIPPGVPMILVPISNNHPTKNWEYSVKENAESSTSSD